MRLFVAICLIFSLASAAPRGGRIFGGQDASEGQFPFIVAFNDPNQFCAGTIIDKRWILTAAHCLLLMASTSRILVGTPIEHSGGTEYNISKTIYHEDFLFNAKNDIALVQIDGTLEYSDNVQPIELGDVGANVTCTAIGWGTTENTEIQEILQYVDLETIDLDYCLELSEDVLDGKYLGPEQVCTMGSKGKGTCYGDSGGPLVCDGKLAGIVSYSVRPCGLELPDVFTRTSAYADWIKNNIK